MAKTKEERIESLEAAVELQWKAIDGLFELNNLIMKRIDLYGEGLEKVIDAEKETIGIVQSLVKDLEDE